MTESPVQYIAVPPSGSGAGEPASHENGGQAHRFPGVLVLHPWWGLTDFIRGVCDRLAQEGYLALAPDMFAGKTAQTISEAEELVSRPDWQDQVPPVVLSAAEALHRHPQRGGEWLGVVGFSFGAYWALWLAQQKPEWLRAVTLFYGTNGGEGDFRRSKAYFLGHFAENDPYETFDVVEAMEKRLKDANRPVQFHFYGGVGHWFFESDRPEAYSAPAAELAWERTLAFLHEQLAEKG